MTHFSGVSLTWEIGRVREYTPWFLPRCSQDWWHPQPCSHISQRFRAPGWAPGHRTASLMFSPLSDLSGNDSPDTTLLLCYCPWGTKTKSVPQQGSASPSGVLLGYLPSQFTSKRKLQGFIGAATESSLEKGTVKALRFNVTCLIEPLEAQSCIKFPYNYLWERNKHDPPALQGRFLQCRNTEVQCFAVHALLKLFFCTYFFFFLGTKP